MKNFIRAVLPKPSIAILLLLPPIAATIYFFVTQYSNKFIVEQNVNFFDIQNGFVRSLIFDNKISDFFLRFSDFAFWGVLAAVILIISWFISVARTTKQNHEVVASFENFQVDRSTWRGHFMVEIGLKVLLVGLVLYLLLLILSTLTPNLVNAIGATLTEANAHNIQQAVLANAYIYLAEIAIVVAMKLFKIIIIE